MPVFHADRDQQEPTIKNKKINGVSEHVRVRRAGSRSRSANSKTYTNMAIPAKVALNEDATSSTETLNSFAREKYADEAKAVSVSERLEENTLVRYDRERRR